MLIRSIILFVCSSVIANNCFAKADFETWISTQTVIAKERLLRNVSPTPAPGERVKKGAIIASPSRENPDYYYHWVRDAALVADVLLSWYEHPATSVKEKKFLLQQVMDFAEFSYENQRLHADLGEPKFYVTGAPYLGPWGRPQNDGPALRSTTLMRLGNILLAAGYDWYFYDRVWPVIRKDLEFVSHEWRHANFDLWEEVKGDHFYTRMVQRRALLEGAEFTFNVDVGFSSWLKLQGDLITQRIQEHFDHKNRRIVENIHRVEGIWYKYSGLDTATLLAVLHTKDFPWFDYSHDYLINTANAIEQSFAELYPINATRPDLGTAIGRYPEDQYYGGNPWILTTLAFAEYYYELGAESLKAGNKVEAGKHLARGDQYLRRVRYHVDDQGSMAEQMRREDGFMVSARDLTWSYAAWLTAAWSRENLTRTMLRVGK